MKDEGGYWDGSGYSTEKNYIVRLSISFGRELTRLGYVFDVVPGMAMGEWRGSWLA
jgi:hypothetical protein